MIISHFAGGVSEHGERRITYFTSILGEDNYFFQNKEPGNVGISVLIKLKEVERKIHLKSDNCILNNIESYRIAYFMVY